MVGATRLSHRSVRPSTARRGPVGGPAIFWSMMPATSHGDLAVVSIGWSSAQPRQGSSRHARGGTGLVDGQTTYLWRDGAVGLLDHEELVQVFHGDSGIS